VRVQQRGWPKLVASAAILVSISLLLSGCFAIAGPVVIQAAVNGKASVATAGKPHKGDCWQATFKDVDGYANWDGPPPVSCTEPHQLYTFGVPTLENPHKGKLFDKNGFEFQAIDNDAFFTCENAENTVLSRVSPDVVRIYFLDILPDESQWDAGARWVRCDVGVFAVGSSVAHPAFESLPSSETLYDSLRDGPDQFDFCVNDPGGLGKDGPKGSNAIYADCRYSPEWKLQAYQYITTGADNTYPNEAQMKAQYAISCQHAFADAKHLTYAYYPSRSDWDGGDQELECWLGQAES
jgi:Septum formation